MHILFVTHYAGFYGANKSLLALLLLLRERYGVQPLVLLPCEGRMVEQLRRNGVPYKVIHYYWWVNYNSGLFQRLLNKRKQLRNWCKAYRIKRILAQEHIDMVYSNSITINMGALIARLLRVPHIWHLRESLVQYNLSLSLSLSLSLLKRKENSAFVLISNYMMHYYSVYLPAERMHLIYNGVTLPQGVERKQTNSLGACLKVACVGVLCEQKNQMELLRAQALLLSQGVMVETYFVGASVGAYLEQMQQYIASQGLEDVAHIVGHTDDVYGFLQDMNLLVVAANNEAFGRVTIEAMLMRMPVVVSDSGANAELIRPDVDGKVYAVGCVEELADALRFYVEHPCELVLQGENGYNFAKTHFSADANAENIYRLIGEVMNK